MRFGRWGAQLSADRVADLLEAALDLGVDTVDLADIYGDHTTNALVGAALAQHPGLRQRLHLVAKIGIVMRGSPGNARNVQYYDLSVPHLRRALDASLSALGVDHLDTLMLHRFDPRLDPDAVADWVAQERRAGRIGRFGVSNFGASALALFDGRVEVVANQIELSLAHDTPLDDGTHAGTRTRGAEVQAWSPLGGGGLLDVRTPLGARLREPLGAMANAFGMDEASLLLRWVGSLPATRVVVGSTRAERLAAAVRACAAPLPRDAWYALWEAARGHPVP